MALPPRPGLGSHFLLIRPKGVSSHSVTRSQQSGKRVSPRVFVQYKEGFSPRTKTGPPKRFLEVRIWGSTLNWGAVKQVLPPARPAAINGPDETKDRPGGRVVPHHLSHLSGQTDKNLPTPLQIHVGIGPNKTGDRRFEFLVPFTRATQLG